MPDSDLIEWFTSLSLYRQVFVVFFTLLVALPIVTLTILQFVESLQRLRRRRESTQDEDADDKP
jgi:hypothetical protein